MEDACTAIDDLIGDFPFVGDPDRAHTFGLLLTVVARQCVDGPAPLHVIDAPTPRTGKTKLAHVIGLVACGRLAVQPPPITKRGDDEWRKRIGSILLGGPQMVLVDNIPETDTLSSPTLAAVITTPANEDWEDRIMGMMRMVRAPAKAVWIVTGNNISIGGDLPQRSVWIRLDANTERPWERTGWRHEDVEGYALENRGMLLRSALIIARNWHARGRPSPQHVPLLGGFESWTRTIGGMLEAAGVMGLMARRNEAITEADHQAEQWRALTEEWWGHWADTWVTSKELCEALTDWPEPTRFPMPDVLAGFDDVRKMRHSLGKHLQRLDGRVLGTVKVRRGKLNRSGAREYQLVAMDNNPCTTNTSAGSAGSAGVDVNERARARVRGEDDLDSKDTRAHAHARDGQQPLHYLHSPRVYDHSGSPCQQCGSTQVWDVADGAPMCAVCNPPPKTGGEA